jgi:hypothetical protein
MQMALVDAHHINIAICPIETKFIILQIDLHNLNFSMDMHYYCIAACLAYSIYMVPALHIDAEIVFNNFHCATVSHSST